LYGSAQHAGTVGFTTSAWLAGFSVFYSFLASSTASAGTMWAQGQGQEAFLKCLSAWKQSCTLFVVVGVCAMGIVGAFPEFPLFQRMTPVKDMFILFIGLCLHLAVAAIALLFRSAKQEPFAKISLASAVICIGVVGLSSYFAWSLFWGFLVANMITLIYCKRFIDEIRRSFAPTHVMRASE
jgi:hypothetical protein